jgi:hypothetical protein
VRVYDACDQLAERVGDAPSEIVERVRETEGGAVADGEASDKAKGFIAEAIKAGDLEVFLFHRLLEAPHRIDRNLGGIEPTAPQIFSIVEYCQALEAFAA